MATNDNRFTERIPFWLRKWLVGLFGLLIAAMVVVIAFLYLFLSSRLSYPERNVLYRVNETVTSYASSLNKYHPDRSSIASISEGTLVSGVSEEAAAKTPAAVKVKAIICTSKRREKGDVDEYELLNTGYQKVAQASTKSERSRAMFDISRSNYIENVAGFVNPGANSEEIKLITLEQAKEIASYVDADTYRFDGVPPKPVHAFRLTDGRRYFGVFGDQFRSSTRLSEPLPDGSFGTVYHSRETGLFGFMPQGSYYRLLGEAPGYFSGWPESGTTGENDVFRITQFWDTLPWRTLNGGYLLSDSKGELAKVRIEDFWFNYDEDVVYWYYLDLDGNGVIDDSTEVIGKALYSRIMSKTSGGTDNKDVSFTVNYSYMAGCDARTAKRDFVLAGDVEAMMPDQVFDGFGVHSYLGYIEEKRDDIMLYLDRSVENLDRALKEDDTLGTKRSIVRLLLAAKRPYASGTAVRLGVPMSDIRSEWR